MASPLKKADSKVYNIIKKEEERQQTKLSMIPSENSFSLALREAVGSVFMHKYAEGYPHARYYEGNVHVDELENLAVERAKKAFRLPKDWGVNVQALSGANANLAVYLALLEFGDTIMAMYLPDGGHLSHGWSFEPDAKKRAARKNDQVYLGGSRAVSVTSKMFKVVQYKTDPKTFLFNYNEIEKIALKYKPKLIITGGTAYVRDIDYKRMRKIADKIGAYYMADVAHEAGLISGGALSSPVGIADVVTMTTHKTLRSGRGAIILAREDLISKINRAVFPTLQGGPHNHNIAGICVGLGEALTPSFKRYAKQIVVNAKSLAKDLQKQGFSLVTGGTDKHSILIDLNNEPILGKKFARVLDYAGIVTNFCLIPHDMRGPADPSGLRIGTPWLTTRGMKQKEMKRIAAWMRAVMEISREWKDQDFAKFEASVKKSRDIQRIAKAVQALCRKFPLEI